MKRLRAAWGALSAAWLFLGVCLLLLLALEIASRLALSVWVGADAPDPRSGADTYAGADWAAGYYEEYRGADRMRWAPWVYWRRQPFEGRSIRVDERGVRRTWSAAPRAGAGDAAQVLFLGGSTAWGTGARDEHTIPSLLARALAERGGREVAFTNLGESGYTSTQELIALLLELRAGRVPDLVIFYDGVNDVGSAHVSGAGGLPFNECNRVREFNLLNEKRRFDLYAAALTRLFVSSGIGRVAAMLGASDADAARQGPVCAELRHADTSDAALAREIVDAYAANLERVGPIAQASGFRTLFVWQPTIFSKPQLTAWERGQRQGWEGIERLFRATREQRRASAYLGGHRDFVDLEDLFAGAAEPLFVDWAHLGERGNQLVAQALVPLVEERLPATPRPAPEAARPAR